MPRARVAPGPKLDGVSLVPVLGGKPLAGARRSSGTTRTTAIRGAPGAAIRRGDWKLIEWFEDDRVELFNLAHDIGETKDLALAPHPDLVDSPSTAELKAWRSEVGARMPRPNPNYDPSAPDGRAATRPKRP